MMWTRVATVALCLAGMTAHAQSANDGGPRLESCIQAARLAEALCSKIPDDPMPRADCFAKARAAQLECLDRALSEAAAETAPPTRSPPLPEPPAETKPSDASAERPASNETARTDQPDLSVGSNAPDEPAKPSEATPQPAPASDAAPAATAPTGAIQSSESGRTGQPDVSVSSNSADEAAKPSAAKASDAAAEPAPASVVPPPQPEAPTGAIQSTSSDSKVGKSVAEIDWIVSETTSPVDYSPLVTAVVRSTSNATDRPNTLTIRCRARHTELSIRSNGARGVRPGNELLIDQQINDGPVVRQPWVLSKDGKTAAYKNDSVELLRSIPEGATLKIAVADKSNVRLAATFELSGLSVIRQKVRAACKWAPVTAKASSEKP
jgi:hypothetical protein